MHTRIHVGFQAVEAAALSLRHLASVRGKVSGFDLSSVGSDLAASAAQAFASGWSDALRFLAFTSTGLAGGVDAALADFLAGEQAHLDALTISIGALEK
ncbi:hypothetical protein [Microbacterium sp. LCT-H2]|uniref:hypothetical protein n=1 Tax=Microbacterium sp. LCT-H2 TaxID=1914306 RepID=UPI0008F53E8F|nr:hypothetical protein [Microbacterium sp. LCT-H2]OIJ31851.1 hypothetical protein BK819_14855 [Microbacterium sp. LCT-H2]